MSERIERLLALNQCIRMLEDIVKSYERDPLRHVERYIIDDLGLKIQTLTKMKQELEVN